jgi:hypothetical protein
VPVITAALKILQDTGVMSKQEAENIESEVTAKTSEAEKLANDPDIKNSGTETTASASSSSSSSSGDNSTDSSSDSGGSSGSTGGGIIGFVKKQPLIAIGGVALGVWGLSKLLGGKKSSGQGVSGVSGRKRKKGKAKGKSHSENTRKNGKRRPKSITLS